MNRARLAVAAAVTLAAAIGAAHPATAAQQRRTPPTVTINVNNDGGRYCPSGNDYGLCWTKITLNSDPTNVYVRAWERCSGETGTRLGSWHDTIGSTSSTSSCNASDSVSSAGYDYSKTNDNQVTCYTYPAGTPGPISRSCTG